MSGFHDFDRQSSAYGNLTKRFASEIATRKAKNTTEKKLSF